MLAAIRSTLFTLPAVFVVTFVHGMATAAVGYLALDKSGKSQHRIARSWAKWVLRVCGVKLKVEGLENIPPGGSFVFVANHRSYLDIPLVLPDINVQFRFLAKKSAFYWPFIGEHLRKSGHLPVHYDNPRESLKTMAAAARVIQRTGVSILLFPEAGRTAGQMDPFKDGAAYIAIKAGVPVIPMGIKGMTEILPVHGNVIRPGNVTIRIGKPVDTIDMTLTDRTRLTRHLFEQVCALCDYPLPAEKRAA